MSNTSFTGSGKNSLTGVRSSKNIRNNSRAGSMANARRRRGGRKTRSSFGSRSRVNQSNASNRSNYRKVFVDGIDVTPVSLLPPLNSDEQAPTAQTATTHSNAGGVSRLQKKQPLQRKSTPHGLLRQVEPAVRNSAAPEVLADAQLDEDVVITLTETDTIELFHLRGYVVHQESDLQRVVSAQNEGYKAVFEKRKNKDLFSTASAQTVNPSSKSKKVQAKPPLTRDAEVTVSNWDIYDAQTKKNVMDDWVGTGKEKDDEAPSLAKGVRDLVTMCLATPGSLLNVDAAEAEEAARKKAQAASGLDAGRQALQEKAANRILSSSALNDALRLVERIIQQGYYHTKQLAYHDLPPIVLPDMDVVANVSKKVAGATSPAPPDHNVGDDATIEGVGVVKSRDQRLELQWSFKCEMTKGRNVSSMVWNPKNPNLLAVAYGSFDFGTEDPAGQPQDGMVLFWSLKNPEFPERALRLSSGVTSIDFSTARPHILAAGLYDGSIAIYDTRLPTDEPIFESNIESGRHSDTVWQVKWIMRGGDQHTETLVSLSTDGRVKEWFMKKGLTHVDLMTLKRVANQTGPQWRPVNSKGEGVISRLGNGLCFSFPTATSDTVIYYVGTEDGVIHKCSSSYNEQYLGSYHGHTGPVYKIKCHPINPNVFLSCSADWAVKLWSTDKEDDSELTFHQMDLNDVVHDVEWAPHNATMFASVTADGRIEIWDVHQSALVPAICHRADKVVDEVALAKALEEARLENLKKKKKKKLHTDPEYDEFGDEEDAEQKQEEDEEPEVEVAVRAKKLSCVRFADGAQIVVTGDDTGAVDVYKIFGLELNDALRQNKPKELEWLRQAMHPSVMRNAADR